MGQALQPAPGVSTFSGQGAYRNVGQVVNLRPIVNRPGAGPSKLSRRWRQPRRYRVPLDVMNNPLKLRIVANQPIIALVLPEWLASESQHSVALPGSESFERLHHLGNCLQWSHQEMNMVRHNDKRMELIGPLVPIVNGIHHHLRDLGHAQEERAVTGGVEDTVHGQESSSGGDCRGKAAALREAAMQAPCEEGSLADTMIVWQSAAAEGGHEKNVGIWRKDSHKRQPADCQSAAGCQPAPHLMPPVPRM